MAAPDTSNLTSSAQVFETHTLPQIRAIHKSLHVQIDEKAARLRTQVGNSYRELLGTADTIVQMRKDMSNAQNVLGRMGSMCGRTVVESKVAGLGRFQGAEDTETELSQTARVRLLEACALAVGRLLKGGKQGKGDRLVLAAKVLVLIRLLVASFGDANRLKGDIQKSIETAKRTQRSLKNKLLRGVAKILDKVSDDIQQDDILKALCAYSLTESSGAKDVLRHFLNVRAEAMVLEFDVEEEQERGRNTDNVLCGLDLYTRTLLDVQALVPSKLADALANLKKSPLLADDSLKALEGLRLDVFERWCGDDIQYFTPFIRHDDLDGKQAKSMLTSWANKGGEILLAGLSRTLEHMSEFKSIIDLRTNVLQHWIRDGGKARGFDPSDMLDGLRDAINARLLHVLDTKVSKLRLIGSEVTSTLETWQNGAIDTRQSLWDEEMLDMDISLGASHIKHEVVSRLHGRNDAVARAVSSYESWYNLIDDVGQIVQQLRRQRWDNDVDEIEDDETIELRQELLSKEDPQKIDDQLNKNLEQAYQNLDGQLGKLWQAHQDDANSGQIAMYFLRIIRSVRSQLPKLDNAKSFGLGSISSLQERLAIHVVKSPVEDFVNTALTRKRVIGRVLWEGEPALPVQPSPGSFKLLRNLVASMGDVGLDLWSPAALSVIKKVASSQLSDVWRAKLDEPIEAQVDSEKLSSTGEDESANETTEDTESVKPKDEEPDVRHDLLIQWLYDILLLQTSLGTDSSPNEDLVKLADVAFHKTGLPDEARHKMVKTSQEYWRRTSLLFGLLA
ncbi:hypothetical protein BKA67DRAFT_535477 [Truncatella angustata]|uniref:Conserved oligomeric Golgi complex subunit 1 n=1 Tax=Truncatella angustata TaxID=152316 RepID=A0A9P8UL72_9PEZI|nr:uncharacterized protein BKA67DRAFT_535477 [Truncatella angustata]KAH6654143.1 hypothetical protein BKA67DRAFT_535477 [Truncatella angustata]KAH8205809.1 hypothetical protein TruAng_000085 [Truncatella angustata]